jgi:3-oxoacyl-[acyl-carrier protein] reductase
VNLQLNEKRALITGSTQGIGAAIAQALAAEGAAVVIHGRKATAAEKLRDKIIGAGGRAAIALGDLTQDSDAERVAQAALSAFGGIDILVNNAGAYPMIGWVESKASDWHQAFETNVYSAARITRLIVPQMRERGWGRILFLASNAAAQPSPAAAAYSAAKAANLNQAVSLAKELAKTGITVNAVSPGPVITEGWNEFALELGLRFGWGDDLAVIKQKLLDGWFNAPNGRLGEPEDVANLVAYLASPLAVHLNGTNFRVDGGLTPTTN